MDVLEARMFAVVKRDAEVYWMGLMEISFTYVSLAAAFNFFGLLQNFVYPEKCNAYTYLLYLLFIY